MANPHQIYRRDATWRKHVLRSQATALLMHGSITTTLARAKELRKHVEKLITKGKKDTLAARRNVIKFIRHEKTKEGIYIMSHLFNNIAPKYKDRNGGYTRIIKLPARQGDSSKMAIIELV
ncbi:50S ribosomal protein L17 [Mesomycoplasma conjunctivae]|uniref:Large ribosomal subunit protein bL17 n=1 Tax=Mesomycoplasma conjunctivae (strain ATCC 25834 / NCTC 10147 / HRC/581) TaxID=572263 RepID=C5J5V7_MESCH|nr:50S ribosomal protein L17 [Mesomycoplasma conjunctivae]CAT04846.1 50S ribosomal protein L17 [Mesomycoplasma conjunctivae]VEU65910.1 50S ribosomal protein L17 [Mesomycoplasma conjunctivae]